MAVDVMYISVHYGAPLLIGLCFFFIFVLKKKWIIEKLKWFDEKLLRPGSYFRVLMVEGNTKVTPFLVKRSGTSFKYEWPKGVEHTAVMGYYFDGLWNIIARPEDFMGLDLSSYDGDGQTNECNREMRMRINDLFDFENKDTMMLILLIISAAGGCAAAFMAYKNGELLNAIKTAVDTVVVALVKK